MLSTSSFGLIPLMTAAKKFNLCSLGGAILCPFCSIGCCAPSDEALPNRTKNSCVKAPSPGPKRAHKQSATVDPIGMIERKLYRLVRRGRLNPRRFYSTRAGWLHRCFFVYARGLPASLFFRRQWVRSAWLERFFPSFPCWFASGPSSFDYSGTFIA